jgi:two-component system, NtrC family, response regulator AtoC
MLSMKHKIMIVDDDQLIYSSLKRVLTTKNYDVVVCTTGGAVMDTLMNEQPELVLLDIYLGDASGLDILPEVKKIYPQLPVIMMTAYSDVQLAVNAMKNGAEDFIVKPINLDQLDIIIHKALQYTSLQNEVARLKSLMEADSGTANVRVLGASKAMITVMLAAEKYAQSEDTTVLIEGESGTGKELIARFIHKSSRRSDGPFVSINCGAIPRDLAESELFGYEKGAFTGASDKMRQGRFELANGGTILLDEIGELSLDVQVKLLRVLQERTFYRLGGSKEISVNVRVLAATNRSLEKSVEIGTFREDLFYRLNVATLIVPPLRERKEDISLLAYAFMNEFAEKFNKSMRGIAPDAVKILESHTWKGNVRELRNTMERVVLLIDSDVVKAQNLSFLTGAKPSATEAAPLPGGDSFAIRIPSTGVKMNTVLHEVITRTLKLTDGNQVQAAKILGLSRSKLRYRMEQLGIEVAKNVT